MQHSRTRLIVDGAVAGLIGGMVIAVWFFIFDAAQGEPLKTPAILATALLHGANQPTLTSAAWILVAEYMLAHFIAFAIIGAAAAMLMASAEKHSELFGTLFLFTIGFEVFFIALLMLLGPAAQAAVSWWKGMIGNLMATAAMLAYFFWRQPALASNLLGPWMGVAREGIITGLIGAIIVAVWFLVSDALAGHPFRTPALLGAIIFNGMSQPSSFAVTAALVLGYTGLHFFAFIMFGIAASITMYASEREPLDRAGRVHAVPMVRALFRRFSDLPRPNHDASTRLVEHRWRQYRGAGRDHRMVRASPSAGSTAHYRALAGAQVRGILGEPAAVGSPAYRLAQRLATPLRSSCSVCRSGSMSHHIVRNPVTPHRAGKREPRCTHPLKGSQ